MDRTSTPQPPTGPLPTPDPPTAPVANRRPEITTVLGHERVDDYAWLRNREDPAVLAHLRAENAFTDAVMEPTRALQETLFNEMKGRIQETDVSVPLVQGPYAYVTRTEEGRQYAIHARAHTSDPHRESTLLDENKLADGHEFFALGTFEVSPSHDLLAYAIDTDGDEVYRLAVKDLTTGLDLPDVVEETAPGCAWAADSNSLLYVTLDEAMRPWQVWCHRLGTSADADTLVLQEDDDRFYVGLSVSSTDAFVFIQLGSQVTTEVHVAPTARIGTPELRLHCVAPREQDVEYDVDHHVAPDGSERWLIVSNHGGATNFRLFDAAVDSTSKSEWRNLGLHPTADQTDYGTVKLDAIDVFRRHIAMSERADGLERIRLLTLDDHGNGIAEVVLTMPEPYLLSGEGPDTIRSFVIPVPGGRGRFVRAAEFHPGNARVVHHANIKIDSSGSSRRLDADEATPGFDGSSRDARFPDGYFLGWTPGQRAHSSPGDAWYPDPKDL